MPSSSRCGAASATAPCRSARYSGVVLAGDPRRLLRGRDYELAAVLLSKPCFWNDVFMNGNHDAQAAANHHKAAAAAKIAVNISSSFFTSQISHVAHMSHSLLQLFANTAIAASRVSAYPSVGVRSS